MYKWIFRTSIVYLLYHMCIATKGNITTLLDTLSQNRSSSEVRIVGGERAKIEDYPFMVSLKFYGTHICGGAIITNKHVLSAAHCVDSAQNDRSGFELFSLSVGSRRHRGKTYEISTVIIHPNYQGIFHDLAIAVLESSFQWSDKIQPIKLAMENFPAKTKCTILGWGYTTKVVSNKTAFGGTKWIEERRAGSKFLLKTNVYLTPDMECYDKYSVFAVSLRCWLCAQDVGKDTCQGDSGGPLVHNNILIGVTSFGFGCAHPDYPGAYVNITNYFEWVWKTVGDSSKSPKSTKPNKISLLICIIYLVMFYLY